MDPYARQLHVEELADELDVVFRFKRGTPKRLPNGDPYPGDCDGGVDSLESCYVTAESFTTYAYLCALHELGHHASGHCDSWRKAERLQATRLVECEAEAWLWALDQYREPVTPEVIRVAESCIASYAKHDPRSAGSAYVRLIDRLAQARASASPYLPFAATA